MVNPSPQLFDRRFYFSNAQLNHTLFIEASAMPTLLDIGAKGVPNKSEFEMNSKLVYAATLALSLVGTFVVATEGSLAFGQAASEPCPALAGLQERVGGSWRGEQPRSTRTAGKFAPGATGRSSV